MKEILGHSLKQFFESCKFEAYPTYLGIDFEVWIVDDKTFEEMCDMSETKFEELCSDGWWSHSEGSVLGSPDDIYKVNNNDLLVWNVKRNRDYCCLNCNRFEEECNGDDEDIFECYGEKYFKSLSEYLCNEVGATTGRNVCACAVDLARYNGISLGELFNRYQGGHSIWT